MTPPVNIMALFCEDIREENGGVFTLVGILPDNVNISAVNADQSTIPKIPSSIRVLGKLCIWIRINFAPDYEVGEALIRMVTGDGEQHNLGSVRKATIDEAREKAKARGNLLAGVISRVVLGNFDFSKAIGPLKLEVDLNDETYLAGTLNIQFRSEEDDDVISPNES